MILLPISMCLIVSCARYQITIIDWLGAQTEAVLTQASPVRYGQSELLHEYS